jgi:hypothetical protein
MKMGTLKATIDALQLVSNIFGIIPVPLVQESLKSAAEMACRICELVQVCRNELPLFNKV